MSFEYLLRRKKRKWRKIKKNHNEEIFSIFMANRMRERWKKIMSLFSSDYVFTCFNCSRKQLYSDGSHTKPYHVFFLCRRRKKSARHAIVWVITHFGYIWNSIEKLSKFSHEFLLCKKIRIYGLSYNNNNNNNKIWFHFTCRRFVEHREYPIRHLTWANRNGRIQNDRWTGHRRTKEWGES